MAAAIKSVKRTRRPTPGGMVIETMDVTLHDKLGALKTLAEYHGLTDSGTMNENVRRMLNLLEAIGPPFRRTHRRSARTMPSTPSQDAVARKR